MRIDNHNHIGVDPLFYQQGWMPYCMDLPRFFCETGGHGMDRFVVFPFVSYMDLDQDALRANRIALAPEEERVPYRFENRRLCEDIRRAPAEWREQLWPFLIFDPARKPREQVGEWKKLPSDYRVYGIKVQGTIIQSKVLALLDQGRVALDYAEEHNIPFLIHSSIRPDDEWSQCADILRVAEARPGVRFVLAHSCRYHQPSLERVAALPNTWFDCSAHVIHCRLATENHPAIAVPAERFPADYHRPEKVLQALAEAFPGKLIWGTDTPFHSIAYDKVQMSSSYAAETACLDALPAPLADEIACRNTLAWLHGGAGADAMTVDRRDATG